LNELTDGGYLEVWCSRFVEQRDWKHDICSKLCQKTWWLTLWLLVYSARLLCICNLHHFLLVFAGVC